MALSPKTLAVAALSAAERVIAPRRPPLAEIRNFLLLQYPLALGTAIHATPLVDALHAAVPGARVAVAASGFGLHAFRNNPGVERLVETPSPIKDWKSAAAAIKAAKFFAGEPFVAIQARGNERSTITLAAMTGGAHRRVGYGVLEGLMEATVPWHEDQSLIANNLQIIGALGRGAALEAALARDPEIAEPKLFPSLTETTKAIDLLRESGIDEAKPIAIFVTQTSVTQRKSWRAERFRAAAERLHREYGMQIVFVGTKEEAAAIDELREPLAFSNANLAGMTSILELVAVMQLADVALALDTGPMHLARAAQLPMVIVAPAWSPEIEWLPVGSPRARILKNLTISLPAPDDYIIDEVSVGDVEKALRELLAAYPPQKAAGRE